MCVICNANSSFDAAWTCPAHGCSRCELLEMLLYGIGRASDYDSHVEKNVNGFEEPNRDLREPYGVAIPPRAVVSQPLK